MFGWDFSWFSGQANWLLGNDDVEPPLTGAMRAFLMGDSAIAGVISSDPLRIRPLRLPQKPTLPMIIIRRISDVGGAHLRGINGLSKARYQVDCWSAGTDPDTAPLLGSYCARRLDGYSGRWTTTGSPAQSISVTVFQEMEQDLFEEEIQGGLCRHSADYFLYHRLT